MVECQLPKLDVAGSNPVSRSIFSMSLSVPPPYDGTTFAPQKPHCGVAGVMLRASSRP